MNLPKIGVLAFHGDVIEHIKALESAAKSSNKKIKIIQVRDRKSLEGLRGLVIPGGESTTLFKLCERENMIPEMKRIQNIFGTCAGAIMLSKKVTNIAPGQKTLELMDLDIDRNAYGRQTDSFTQEIKTDLGKVKAVFIRAPRIRNTGPNVKVLAESGNEVIACEEKVNDKYYLVACFHPELTTSIFHQYFLKKVC